MESSVYTSLGQRINRTFPEKRENELFTLKDFLERKFIIKSELELKKVFVKDFKNILLKEDLFELIQDFFELETDLSNACEQLEFETTLFNFDEFYKNLSPVFMRALLENAGQRDNASAILKSIKEALRIAIEEELAQFEDLEISL